MNKLHLWWRNTFVVLLILFFCYNSYAQTKTISGTVMDQNGTALAGVSVSAGTAGTSTDEQGHFTIAVPATAKTLRFSIVGYQQQDVNIGNKNSISVALHNVTAGMTEVVVVGYGTAKKSDVTGAVTSISAKTIQERPAQNVLQAMQGKAAGVQISSNLKPGELPVIRIRGQRSLTASNDPLYVVDGIPIVNALGVNSFSVADLNPNDIASIEILKDASATAIYGSRGANGVVLITTKKGTKGRVNLSYNGTLSFDRYHSMTDWMDAGEYVDRWRQALINGRLYNTNLGAANADLTKAPVIWYPDPFLDRSAMTTLQGDPAALSSVWAAYEWVDRPGGTVRKRPTTAEEKAMGWPDEVPVYNSKNIRGFDWLEAATRTGITNNHQVSLTAGSANSREALSLGYFEQLGVQRDQDYRRYNASLNGDINANKWLTLGSSVIGSFSTQNYGILGPNTSNTGSKDLYSRAADQFPFAQPQDSAGNWIRNAGGNINLWNPLVDIEQVKNERRTSSVMTNVYAEIKFTPWLKFRGNYGIQYRHFRTGSWTGPEATPHLTNRASTAGYGSDENFSWVAENLLYFDKSFGKMHTVGLTLLQSAQKSRREGTSTSVTGTINPLSMWYDLRANTAGNPGYSTNFTENTLASYMARANYNLMDKYLLTLSGRLDGSSVLASGHKWDFFPSFALAWKLQDEPFMKNINWINELKPRIGYGEVGNSSVPPYTTSGPLSLNPYAFGSTAAIGYLPQLPPNPLLAWEKTASGNVGIDFRILNSRLSGTVEVYQQNTSNLLNRIPLPAVSGYVEKVVNVGKTRNRGIEVTLSTMNISKGEFTWSTDFNWTRNKEELVELLNGQQDVRARNWFIGEPQDVFFFWDYGGIWGSSQKDLEEMAKFKTIGGLNFVPGTIRPVDLNGDYKLTADDYVILGTPRPKWSGGITNNLRYKGWTLNSFVYFRWGQMYFGGYPNYGGANPNGRLENDVWSFSNQNARWPMPNFASGINNFAQVMQYNEGSFGVVRNVSLSYNFPKSMMRRFAVNDLTLNVQVLNPWMFGPRNSVVNMGINPEDDTNWGIINASGGSLGGTNNNTILPQSIVFGLRAGF